MERLFAQATAWDLMPKMHKHLSEASQYKDMAEKVQGSSTGQTK